MKRTIYLYSSEKYDAYKERRGYGSGNYQRTIRGKDEEELDQKEKELKQLQDIANKEWRILHPAAKRGKKDYSDQRRSIYHVRKNENIGRKQSVFKEDFKPQEISSPNQGPLIQNTLTLPLAKNTGNSVVIFGSSKAGKSTLMSHIYQKYFKKAIPTLFTINWNNKAYGRDFKPIMYKGWNREAEEYIHLQRKINMETSNRYTFLNMIDDIISVNTSPIVNDLILTLRNANINSIINLQYPRLLSKMARANANFIIFFRFNSEETIIDAIDVFLGSHFRRMGIKTKEEQIEKYKELTKDYGFIVLEPMTDKVSFHRLKKNANKK